MNKKSLINIGTSGWVYKHWRGRFYPDNLAEKDYLKYYSQHFSTVEVNNSFYHLLSEKAVKSWVQSVPEDFVFVVKASRYITHMKRLKDPESSTLKFFESIKPFENKLGPILFQLPPKFAFNKERFETFFQSLPQNCRYAFEFRDKSWFNDETYDILRKNNAALCIYNLGLFQSPKEVTADFAYLRLHGNYGLGSGKYTDDEIKGIANDIDNFKSKCEEVFCYFNNDEAGFAIENALALKQKFTH